MIASILRLSITLLLLSLVSACGTLQAGVENSSPLPPATTAVAEPPTAPAAPTETLAPPTEAPSAPAPTSGPTQPPQSVPTDTPVPQLFSRVKIYLIAINDAGKSGPQIGCGDSVIAVDREITPTNAPLKAALEALLSIHDQHYGQSGLYNALYQSNLRVQSVTINNGVARIALTGTFQQGGVCDSPRIEAQLTSTALQFSTVKSAEITINGKSLQELLSSK